MKRILFIFVGVIGLLSLNAQDCAKACDGMAKKTTDVNVEQKVIENAVTAAVKKDCASACSKMASASTSSETRVASVKMTAEEAAAKDESIETVVNPATGEMSFIRKHECMVSKKVTTTEVNFDEESQVFIAIADAHHCTEECKAVCAAKSCCEDKSCTKSCCDGKSK